MTAQRKGPRNWSNVSLFSFRCLTEGNQARMFTSSKHLAHAMTHQVYTQTIAKGKSIGNAYALVSPKHCEHSVFGSLTFKKDQNQRVDYRPTPVCHDKHSLQWRWLEEQVQASGPLGYAWKVGEI